MDKEYVTYKINNQIPEYVPSIEESLTHLQEIANAFLTVGNDHLYEDLSQIVSDINDNVTTIKEELKDRLAKTNDDWQHSMGEVLTAILKEGGDNDEDE